MYKNDLLNIIMPTFNHEKFIGKAIESVLNQKCNFSFKLVISDDFSMDNTIDVCIGFAERYPSKIKLMTSNKNIGIARNYKKLFDACHSTYIAILEGDDYWTDPYKLQKQIDILSSNEKTGFVHTGFEVLFSNGEKKVGNKGVNLIKLQGAVLRNYPIINFTISPLTVCFKRSLLKYIDLDFIIENELQTVDAFLWTEFAHYTEFAYIPEITGCYRILKNSISNTNNISQIRKSNDTVRLILKYFIVKYNIDKLQAKNMLNRQYFFMIGQYIERKMWNEAAVEAEQAYTTNFSDKLKMMIVKNHYFRFSYILYLHIIKFGSKCKQLFSIKFLGL